MKRALSFALGLVTAVGLAPFGVSGQETDSAAAAPVSEPAPDTAVWIAVTPRPRSTVVAATVTFPAGSGNDPDGRGGTAWLLGRSLETVCWHPLAGDLISTVFGIASTFWRFPMCI